MRLSTASRLDTGPDSIGGGEKRRGTLGGRGGIMAPGSGSGNGGMRRRWGGGCMELAGRGGGKGRRKGLRGEGHGRTGGGLMGMMGSGSGLRTSTSRGCDGTNTRVLQPNSMLRRV